jgi:FkbM family methyltransferase
METPKFNTFLFGAGAAAWWILQGFSRSNFKVEGFLDDNASEIVTRCGFSVWSPEDPMFDDELKRNSNVVISIMNPKVKFETLRSRLMGFGWCNVTTFDDYISQTYLKTGINLSIFGSEIIKKQKLEFIKLRNILKDDLSIEILDFVESYNLTCDISKVPFISQNQYFPPDLPRWPTTLTLLDLGAFDGLTILQGIESGYFLDTAICFEPDERNYSKLVANLKNLENVICLPLGVSDQTSKQYLSSSGDAGSRLTEKGNQLVQLVKVDDLFQGYKFNLVKMDIEGSELSALNGASAAISRNRPYLAISVYHLGPDFTKIPLFIHQLYQGRVDMYLRKHGLGIADIILYAHPE